MLRLCSVGPGAAQLRAHCTPIACIQVQCVLGTVSGICGDSIASLATAAAHLCHVRLSSDSSLERFDRFWDPTRAEKLRAYCDVLSRLA